MSTEERHVADIMTSGKLLLKILDFEGGVIWDIRPANRFGDVVLRIEHPDLPLIEVSQPIQTLQIMYKVTYGEGNCLLKVERVEPAKNAITE